MKKQISCNIIFLFTFLSIASFSQNEKEKSLIQAKIKYIKIDNFVTIFAEATNETNVINSEIDYTFLSVKKSASGNTSKNQQSGEFSIVAGEIKKLSKQLLNIDEGDEIKIYLFLKKNKKLISKDTLSLDSFNKKYSNKPIAEVDFEISGLTVENVMTKLGKDFYEFFNQINRLNNISYPFVIIVNEKPSVGGQNSEISVVINDDIVYRFRTQPKESYLYSAALEANKQIYKYHVNKKVLKKKTRVF
jgi:hypothetical protein